MGLNEKTLIEIEDHMKELHKNVGLKIETIIDTSKAIAKYELALNSASKNRELLIDFLIRTKHGVIETERPKAEIMVDEYSKLI